jgi:hypothetical protein
MVSTLSEACPDRLILLTFYFRWCTMTVAVTCFVVAFNSAVVTADIEGVAKEFHVSVEVALLSITLFVIGFGVGTSKFFC